MKKKQSPHVKIQLASSTNSHLAYFQNDLLWKWELLTFYCCSRLSQHIRFLVPTVYPSTQREDTHTGRHTHSFALLDLAWAHRFGSIEKSSTVTGFKGRMKEREGARGGAATLTLWIDTRLWWISSCHSLIKQNSLFSNPLPFEHRHPDNMPPRTHSDLGRPGRWQLFRSNRPVGNKLPGRKRRERKIVCLLTSVWTLQPTGHHVSTLTA